MNKERRKELGKLINKLEILKSDLENIQSDEEMSFDAIPENLQGGMRAMESEEAVDKISEAVTALEEAIELIEYII